MLPHCLPKCTALKSEGRQPGSPLSHNLLLFSELLSFKSYLRNHIQPSDGLTFNYQKIQIPQVTASYLTDYLAFVFNYYLVWDLS